MSTKNERIKAVLHSLSTGLLQDMLTGELHQLVFEELQSRYDSGELVVRPEQ